MMGKVLNELLAAIIATSLIQTSKHDCEWSIIYSYYVNMGGFVLDFTDFLEPPTPLAEVPIKGYIKVGDSASYLVLNFLLQRS